MPKAFWRKKMFAYELPLDPPCDKWEEYEKPMLIKNLIKEICGNIVKKGEDSRYADIYDNLYVYIEDNLEKFLHEDFYE